MRTGFRSRFSFTWTVLACVVGTIGTTSAQAQRPVNQQTSDSVIVNKDEVPFDVVVRDKKGRLINDLTAADFEVYEDGVMQEVNSFRLMSPASAPKNPGSATPSAERGGNQSRANDPGPPKVAPDRAGTLSANTRGSNVSAVALVFDRLSPDARARAYKAALSYLQEGANDGEMIGVFITDLSVVVLQPFTDDRQLIRSGIEKAGTYSPSLYASTNADAQEKREILRQDLLRQQSGLKPVSSAAPSLGSPGAAMAQMELYLLERAELDQRDQLGDAGARGLLSIASSLHTIPGRKAIIFFSEGMILPPSAMGTFRALISTANRNNVSFYNVDAAGLRAESKTAETVREMSSRNDYRMTQLGSKADPEGPMTKGIERNEDLLRLNPDNGLDQLANETGGFLITDSNDLKGRLRQVEEDLHTYYLMSYSPKNQNFDGHFRKIEVKVKRPGLVIQSRKGYYAIKGTFASPVLAYEVPMLAALEKEPKADSFPFDARGFSFPERERTGFVPVIAELPLSAFTFRADKEKQLYDTDFSVVALLKDQTGQVVEKLSRQYRLSGALDQVEREKLGRVLFYREAELEPGRYTLETIAYDAPTGRASVRTGTIEVPATDNSKLRLSDVVILKRAEPAGAADEKHSHPFHVANMLVTPNLGEPIRKSLKQIPFFFTVYTAPGPRLKLTIELRQQGRTLAQMPGDLPEADTSGRIQYLAGLPLEKIPTGSYELRVTVGDETTSVTRSCSFTIMD